MSSKKSLDVQDEKKVMGNLNKCSKCRLSLIYEELETHTCFSGNLKDVVIDSSNPYSMLIFDGYKWHKCPISKRQPKGNRYKNNHQGNSTIFSNELKRGSKNRKNIEKN